MSNQNPNDAPITNLQRAMWAETTLSDFSNNVDAGDSDLCKYGELYDEPATVAKDLIINIFHYLHADEKANCMSVEKIYDLLNDAFEMFKEEIKHD